MELEVARSARDIWGSWVTGNGNAVHVVCTQCKLLYVGSYLNPSFGFFFLPVGCFITEFFMLLVH